MSTISKINSLNGIRGFAILLVLMSHTSNAGISFIPGLSFSGSGRYGVFLFFVLSSFLLTRQFLYSKPDTSEMSAFLGRYFSRRFLRIFPLYTAALTLYYILHKIGYSVYVIDELVLLKSFFLMAGKGVFWTIPVEFEYYFILPIVAIIFLKVKNITVILVSVTMFTVVWWQLFPPHYVPNLLPFLPIFLIGSLAALISYHIDESYTLSKTVIQLFNLLSILAILSFLLIIPQFYNFAFGTNISKTEFENEFLMLSILSGCVVIFTVHSNGLVRKIMEHKIMVFWGNISFSAYLTHIIILRAIESTELSPVIQWFVFMFLTAGFAYLSFKYFEIPLSKSENIQKILLKLKVIK